jgi:hypothetical protein
MIRLRRAFGLLAAAGLLTAQLAVPGLAIAKSGVPAWACTPDASAITARGGIADSRGNVREKDTGQVVREMPAKAVGAAPANLAVSVPIFFHVITSGTNGALTDRQLRAQVAQMNAAYSGTYGGVNTGFSFTFAGADRTDNAVWYTSKASGSEHAMKTALKTGGDGTMNVYTTSGGGYLGYAYLPDITETAQAYLDGIVIDWRTVPGASTEYAGLYDEGDTLVHEAGHWLNLEHTSSASATSPATSWRTRQPRSRRHSAARSGATPARRPAWIRSTTTWTTRTTPASRSSPRARPSACGTPGCSGGPRRRLPSDLGRADHFSAA